MPTICEIVYPSITRHVPRRSVSLSEGVERRTLPAAYANLWASTRELAASCSSPFSRQRWPLSNSLCACLRSRSVDRRPTSIYCRACKVDTTLACMFWLARVGPDFRFLADMVERTLYAVLQRWFAFMRRRRLIIR